MASHFMYFRYRLLLGLLCTGMLFLTSNASAGVLSGSFTSNGGAIDGACVKILQGNDGCNTSLVHQVTTSNGGQYSITLTDDEQYYIYTDANCTSIHPTLMNEHWDGGDGTQACDLALPVTPPATVNIDLQVAAQLSGVISDADGPLNSNSYSIGAQAYTGDPCRRYEHVANDNINTVGNYTITLPQSGTYFIRTTASQVGFVDQWYGKQSDGTIVSSYDCQFATSLTFGSEPAINDINFVLVEGGLLAGHISDSITGVFVPSVDVSAITGVPCGQNQSITGTRANDGGNYLLAGVPLTNVYLRAWDNNGIYQEAWYAGGSGNSALSSPDCSDAVPLDMNSIPDTGGLFDLKMSPAGTISGIIATVVDNTPVFVSGVDTNMIVSILTGDACSYHEGTGRSQIDGSGNFSVGGLDLNDQYLIRFEANGEPYLTEWFTGFVNNLPTSSQDCHQAQKVSFEGSMATITGVKLEVDPGALIKGRVTDMSSPGVAVTNACITVFTDACGDWQSSRVADSWTDNNGDYSVAVPPGAGYQIYVNPECNNQATEVYVPEYWNSTGGNRNCSGAENTLSATLGTPVENINFQLEEGGEIEGTAYDSTTGVPIDGDSNGLAVIAYTGNACDGYDYVTEGHLMGDGRYNIYGVPLGTDLILLAENRNAAFIPEWFAGFTGQPENLVGNSDPDCSLAVPIRLDGITNNVTGANFHLEEGSTIEGRIFDAGDAVNGDDNQMGVTLYADGACENYDWVAADNIDNTGFYSIGGLDKNTTYYATTYSQDAPYQPRWFAGFDTTDPNNPIPLMSDDCSQATPLVFEPDTTLLQKIDFDYEKSPLIMGNVKDYDGQNFQGACVKALSQNCGNWNDTQVGEAWTDNQGNYSLRVPEGQGYYINIDPGCSQSENANLAGYFEGNSSLTGDCNLARQTAVPGIDTPVTGVDIVLQKGAIIKGNVSLDDGTVEGLRNVCINIYDTNSICNQPNWQNSGHSSDDGNYHVVVQFGQEYYLKTDANCGGYETINMYWNNNTANGTYNCAEAATIASMQDGDPDAVANFVLEPAVIISGTVKDEVSTAGINSIAVRAKLNKCDNGEAISWAISNDQSGTAGEYRLFVPPGVPVYLETCVNCNTEDSGYMDIWYPDATEMDCEQAAQSLTGAMTNIDLALPKDSDGDGISDNDELTVYLTNPNDPDSDHDGINDYVEVYFWGSDFDGNIDFLSEAPEVPGNPAVLNIHETDADNDGVSDLQELARGGDFKDPLNTPEALVLYDDFESGILDPSRWNSDEAVREVRSDALYLSAESFGDLRVTARTPHSQIDNIRTTLTLDQLTPVPGGNGWVSLHGFFYLKDNSVNSPDGLIYASVSIGDEGDGIKAHYYIGEFNENWEISELTSEDLILPGHVIIGNTYELEIKYHDANFFDFSITDVSLVTTYSQVNIAGPAFGSAVDERRGVSVSTHAAGAKVKVSVDSFYTSNGTEPFTVYDNFNTSPLDVTKWLDPEFGHEITNVDGNKKLRILSHAIGERRTTKTQLSQRFDYIQTRVKIDDTSFAEGRYIRARLGGNMYNDTYGPGSGLPYNGYEGNVWGQVSINKNAAGKYYAYGFAERALDKDYNDYDVILDDEIPIDIQAGEEYILYIGFAGDQMIFGVDSVDGTKHGMVGDSIETPKYLPYKPEMRVSARADSRYSSADAAGHIVAYFDDIMVSGDRLEKPGDVNVDGSVDLKDAILALQAMAGDSSVLIWAAGDVNKDGKIGMPEVTTIMSQAMAPPLPQ